MKRRKYSVLSKALVMGGILIGSPILAKADLDYKGFNLVEDGDHPYDASATGAYKTGAQVVVDRLKALGANYIVLNITAHMNDIYSTEIEPDSKDFGTKKEKARFGRLIAYIHSQGMKVGLRPFLLVKNREGGGWHGNIKPRDVREWFESLTTYLKPYVAIAISEKVEQFTLGAELYSMTVGVETIGHPDYGYPREWNVLINGTVEKPGGLKGALKKSNTHLMYDINYTDSTANADGTGESGGEIKRWRDRLVTFKPDESDPDYAAKMANWTTVRDLWMSFDEIGLDNYRSLMSAGEEVSTNDGELLDKLRARARRFARDIGGTLAEIDDAIGREEGTPVIFKEIGWKSCTGGLNNPFSYDDPHAQVDIRVQSLAYQAFFQEYANAEWLKGVAFWTSFSNPDRSGPQDPGFNPLGKPQTEEVIRRGFAGGGSH